LLGGCLTGGTTRWATAPGEDLKINNSTYRVAYLPVEGGGYDLRSHYNEFIGFNDAMIDKINALAAIKEMGTKLCGRPPVIVAETMEGPTLFHARVRCG
jgi:hypothetical protein